MEKRIVVVLAMVAMVLPIFLIATTTTVLGKAIPPSVLMLLLSSPSPSGEVATIEAGNPTSYDGSVPVWTIGLGQSMSMVFIAKDSCGNPVSGVPLTSVYPSVVVTTDGNGQVAVTIPASSFAGWDNGRISVMVNPSIYLEFKIFYHQ